MTWKNQETVGPGNQLKKVFQERGSDPMGHLFKFGRSTVLGNRGKSGFGGMMMAKPD